MLTHQLALTVEKPGLIDAAALTRVAAALQKQATRDFGPIWGVSASVSAFARIEDVPLGYWPVIVVADVKGAAGYHQDQNGQPYALVEVGDSWSLTASHETLEMIADPFGKRLVAGTSPKAKQGRVQFLVEVCDPSEDDAYAYTVNGVMVSDFYTPRYFDPVAASGTRYSYTGAIKAPRTILPGGYLSWYDPKSKHWFQQTWFGGTKAVIRDLGVFDNAKFGSYRAFTDEMTPETLRLGKLGAKSAPLRAARQAQQSGDESTEAQAKMWLSCIAALRKGGK